MNKQEFLSRRQALLAQMKPASAAIFLLRQKHNAMLIVNIPIANIVTSCISPDLVSQKLSLC